MTKKKDHTTTTEFEVEAIEEAYAPDPSGRAGPGKPWRPNETPKLQVEKPPELREPHEHTARIWILERRARGWFAKIRRWFVGKSRR